MTTQPLTDADLRKMHSENQKAIGHLGERLDIVETIYFGKKEDPEDNGLKGDITSIKKGQLWMIRVGVLLIAVFIFTRYPELAKVLLEFAH